MQIPKTVKNGGGGNNSRTGTAQLIGSEGSTNLAVIRDVFPKRDITTRHFSCDATPFKWRALRDAPSAIRGRRSQRNDPNLQITFECETSRDRNRIERGRNPMRTNVAFRSKRKTGRSRCVDLDGRRYKLDPSFDNGKAAYENKHRERDRYDGRSNLLVTVDVLFPLVVVICHIRIAAREALNTRLSHTPYLRNSITRATRRELIWM